MSRICLILLVVVVMVGSVLGKPADEKAVAATPSKADEKAADTSSSTAVDHSGGGWSTYLTEGYSPIVMGTVATLFIVGGLSLGLYYYFTYYYYAAYSQPTGTTTSSSVDGFSGYPPQPGYAGTGYGGYNYQPATGRAIRAPSSFSFDRVLEMISMAQELYEKFDFQSLDCQKKALCELQQKSNDFGETGRQLQGTLQYYVSRSFVEAIEDLPMPKIIQSYLKEYKEALVQGKNSDKDCGQAYPKCSSSIREVFVKYAKKVQKL